MGTGSTNGKLKPRPGEHIVDGAGGTGDIAFRILERQSRAHVTVCDINREMIDLGRDRAIDKGMIPGGGGGGPGVIDWLCGDAEALPHAGSTERAKVWGNRAGGVGWLASEEHSRRWWGMGDHPSHSAGMR